MTVRIAPLDLTATDLRREAARTKDAKARRRMLAIALLLEGHSREQAARRSGMDRQTPRNWVHHYNAEGIEGLFDRPHGGGAQRKLTTSQEAKIVGRMQDGPALETDGVVRWRLSDLRHNIAQRFAVCLHAQRRQADAPAWFPTPLGAPASSAGGYLGAEGA